MKTFPLLLLFFIISVGGCTNQKGNQKKYYQFRFYRTYNIGIDSINVEIHNPLHCPLRVGITLEGEEKTADQFVWLKAKQDTIFKVVNNFGSDPKITFQSSFSTLKEISSEDIRLSLPLKPDKRYKVTQGYNGGFSHQSDYSRYSIDFDLQVGDTVYCAANGYVVGVIKDYDNNGGGRKYRDLANFITVFHPELRVFTQYVHLKYQGSLVKLGDTVQVGQAIGISGNTGFTRGPHLHFNVLKATRENGLKSIPVQFGDILGGDLKKGIWVRSISKK